MPNDDISGTQPLNAQPLTLPRWTQARLTLISSDGARFHRPAFYLSGPDLLPRGSQTLSDVFRHMASGSDTDSLCIKFTDAFEGTATICEFLEVMDSGDLPHAWHSMADDELSHRLLDLGAFLDEYHFSGALDHLITLARKSRPGPAAVLGPVMVDGGDPAPWSVPGGGILPLGNLAPSARRVVPAYLLGLAALLLAWLVRFR
ncbi:hypothetical protein Q8F55_002733 [Vanrija albida]|uniref:BTB domain-containing protein n=1 Tax=Vanrija albida TaxID=181172 RepID=A0ABR3QBM0_9TREE